MLVARLCEDEALFRHDEEGNIEISAEACAEIWHFDGVLVCVPVISVVHGTAEDEALTVWNSVSLEEALQASGLSAPG